MLKHKESDMREASLSKGHPIETLEEIRAIYRVEGIPIRIRYRGPRHDIMRLTCLKQNARTFSVYPR
jgi:hypothetical protein